MRTLIRQVENDRFQNVVVVCGAWHGPALTNWESTKKEDSKRLKKPDENARFCYLDTVTYDRLGWRSGYGAGITSARLVRP